MKISKTDKFAKRYKKLSKNIQKKVDKQIQLLATDLYYPSLHAKKLSIGIDWWEFGIDYHYRMIGKKINGEIILHSVGPHDEGLRKK